jgi:hypothetical protein
VFVALGRHAGPEVTEVGFASWKKCITVSALIFHCEVVQSHSQVSVRVTRGVPLIVIVPRCILQLVPYS